jgi:hypothetical protein
MPDTATSSACSSARNSLISSLLGLRLSRHNSAALPVTASENEDFAGNVGGERTVGGPGATTTLLYTDVVSDSAHSHNNGGDGNRQMTEQKQHQRGGGGLSKVNTIFPTIYLF